MIVERAICCKSNIFYWRFIITKFELDYLVLECPKEMEMVALLFPLFLEDFQVLQAQMLDLFTKIFTLKPLNLSKRCDYLQWYQDLLVQLESFQ